MAKASRKEIREGKKPRAKGNFGAPSFPQYDSANCNFLEPGLLGFQLRALTTIANCARQPAADRIMRVGAVSNGAAPRTIFECPFQVFCFSSMSQDEAVTGGWRLKTVSVKEPTSIGIDCSRLPSRFNLELKMDGMFYSENPGHLIFSLELPTDAMINIFCQRCKAKDVDDFFVDIFNRATQNNVNFVILHALRRYDYGAEALAWRRQQVNFQIAMAKSGIAPFQLF